MGHTHTHTRRKEEKENAWKISNIQVQIIGPITSCSFSGKKPNSNSEHVPIVQSSMIIIWASSTCMKGPQYLVS